MIKFYYHTKNNINKIIWNNGCKFCNGKGLHICKLCNNNHKIYLGARKEILCNKCKKNNFNIVSCNFCEGTGMSYSIF